MVLGLLIRRGVCLDKWRNWLMGELGLVFLFCFGK